MPIIEKITVRDYKRWITLRELGDHLIIHIVGPVEEVSLKDNTLVIKTR